MSATATVTTVVCGPDANVGATVTDDPTTTAAGWWRTGRKVGRTLYAQQGDRPHDSDPLIGVMDTPELAERVVMAVNAAGLSDIAPDDIATYLAQSLVRRGWSSSSAKQYAQAATEVLALRYRMEPK